MAGLAAPRWWSSRGPAAWPWLPFAGLFYLVAALRRLAYRYGWLAQVALPVPVVVVGNLAAGGSGKTPATLWLADALRRAGRRPGILSRGYGGNASGVHLVAADSDPTVVGDEPALLARRSGVPVCIGRDRVAAGRALLAAHPELDVLLTDDGLQHYRLQRAAEVVVVDPVMLGNAWPLPAGPLREPPSRARAATLVLAHGVLPADLRAELGATPVLPMRLVAGECYRLGAPGERRSLAALAALKLRAVAGIGRPQRFFDTLHAAGVKPLEYAAFPDHHAFSAADLALDRSDALLMTEKDAIKCAPFAPPETWVLPVTAEIPDAALTLILERLHGSQAA